MPSFTLSPATPDDYIRMGEIQYDSFKEANDPFVAHSDTSREDYISWAVHNLQKSPNTPNCRTELITARDELNIVVGWISWLVPCETSIRDTDRNDRNEPTTTAEVKIPKGMDTETLKELTVAGQKLEEKYMSGRKYWGKFRILWT
jgi:hypothetical protein